MTVGNYKLVINFKDLAYILPNSFAHNLQSNTNIECNVINKVASETKIECINVSEL